jgi:histidinol phosphatase-like enzyme (inositol monophosphatase family)
MSDRPIHSLLEFAIAAAWDAGRITLAYFQTALDVERKADQSPVTIADRSAEEKLRALIRARYPGDAIVGEEFGEKSGTTGYRWILDPIDGTKSFIHGVPLYGVMVAVEREGRAIAGVVNLPALGEMVYAARGVGCFWNGRRACVSSVDRLDQALLAMTNPTGFARVNKREAYERLVARTLVNRGWGDCYGHVLVATGRADIMLDPVTSIWDCAALQPIVEEAGGTFTDWHGEPTIDGGDAISTNGHLFAQVMDIVSRDSVALSDDAVAS